MGSQQGKQVDDPQKANRWTWLIDSIEISGVQYLHRCCPAILNGSAHAKGTDDLI